MKVYTSVLYSMQAGETRKLGVSGQAGKKAQGAVRREKPSPPPNESWKENAQGGKVAHQLRQSTEIHPVKAERSRAHPREAGQPSVELFC